jgi:TetR/AcrR family transcriptional repressor of lmrAB and yxaGH operons
MRARKANPAASRKGKGSLSRERILRAASDLFEKSGYYGTGLNEIVRKGRAPKGSIYYHFPRGKKQIAAEAVLLMSRTLAEQSSRNLSEKRTAAEAVEAFVDKLSILIMESGYRSGGSLAIVASETAATNSELNKTCREAYQVIRRSISDKLRQRGFPRSRAEALATAITATVEGGVILSRTYHSRKPLQTVAALLGDMVRLADPSNGG